MAARVPRQPLRSGVLALVVLSSACGLNEAPQECAPPYPGALRSRADRGVVRPGAPGASGTRLGIAARDPSVTVLGFCVPPSHIPHPAPSLRAGDRELSPIGGSLEQIGDLWFNYSYYAPTRDSAIEVVQGSKSLGSIVFAREPQGACPLRGDAHVRILTCGIIIIAEWRLPLDLDAEAIDSADVETYDGKTLKPLGFFPLEATVDRGAVALEFGFRPPRTSKVVVRLAALYLHSPTGIREVLLDPPPEHVLKLRRMAP